MFIDTNHMFIAASNVQEVVCLSVFSTGNNCLILVISWVCQQCHVLLTCLLTNWSLIVLSIVMDDVGECMMSVQ